MLIELSDISKEYSKAASPSLSGVNAVFKNGDVVAFIGHNGAGKSTLLNIVCSAITASGGTYRLDGVDITREPEIIRTHMGYFSDPDRSLYLRLSARENVERFCKLKGIWYSGKTKEQIVDLSRRFGLEEHMDQQVRKFSKGMKVKLNILLALLGDNELLIMDEPFAALDGNIIVELLGILAEQAKAGKIILISSNELFDLEFLCNRVIALNLGNVVFDGGIEAVLGTLPGNGALELYCLDPASVWERVRNESTLHIADAMSYYNKLLLLSDASPEDYVYLSESKTYGDCSVMLRKKNLYDFIGKYCTGGKEA